MMLLCLVITLLLHALRCGSLPLAIPLGSIFDINCTNVTIPIWWEVKLNRSLSTLRLPDDAAILEPRGITASIPNSAAWTYSVLHVNGTAGNNGTTVRCVKLSGTTSTAVLDATLLVYERPSPPTGLNVSADANGTLSLTWVPPFAPAGVKLLYKITFRNLLVTPAAQEVVAVDNSSYTRSVSPNVPSCSKYEISVLAVNKAGESDAVKAQVSAPTAPQIDVEQHLRELVFTGGDMAAYFKLYIKKNCSDVPIQSYVVRLYNTLPVSTVTVWRYNSSGGSIVLHTSDGLQPNMKYIYTITATNAYGNSTTVPQTLYTTDVQSSTITGSDHQLNVTCSFAEGSQAKGCVVLLERSGTVIPQRIPRANGVADGLIETELSVDHYNISVVDWEEDGSDGSLIVPVNITIVPVKVATTSVIITITPVSITIIPVNITPLPSSTMTITLTTMKGISVQDTTNTVPTNIPSNSLISEAVPFPVVSVVASDNAQQMLWLIPVVSSFAAALLVVMAAVVLIMLWFILKRQYAKELPKSEKEIYEASLKEEYDISLKEDSIYDAVSNQHSIYATLEPPCRIDATNPGYLLNYGTNEYTTGSAVSNEYALPLDTVNVYATPDSDH